MSNREKGAQSTKGGDEILKRSDELLKKLKAAPKLEKMWSEAIGNRENSKFLRCYDRIYTFNLGKTGTVKKDHAAFLAETRKILGSNSIYKAKPGHWAESKFKDVLFGNSFVIKDDPKGMDIRVLGPALKPYLASKNLMARIAAKAGKEYIVVMVAAKGCGNHRAPR